MKKIMKRVLLTLLIIIISIGAFAFWYNQIYCRWRTITPNHVYKSGLIPPDRLETFLIPHKIKTVVDLLDPGVQDAPNPGKQKNVDDEAKAIENLNKKYNLHIQHINIPSSQVPTKGTLQAFFKVIDNKDNYPILIHCYHGMGRAVIYSAIYRIEKEGWSNKKAQENTRLLKVLVESPLHHSSFAKGREKGDFLLNYKPRSVGDDATINHMDK